MNWFACKYYFRFAVKFNWKDRLKNYAMLQRIAAFACAMLIIFIFLPKEGLFRYEYQPNQPWKHDKLYAPFDFGIRKNNADISAERESIRESQAPVFGIDRSINEAILHRIDERWEADGDSVGSCDSVKQISLKLASALLTQGIIRPDEVLKGMAPFDTILIDRGGALEKKPLSEMLGLKQAIDTVDVLSEAMRDSSCMDQFVAVLRTNLNSNALYNDSLTSKLVNARQDQIIEVEGKVNKGQAIIDRGEIVTDDRYRILESLKFEYTQRTISSTGFQWSLIGELGIVALLLGLLMLFVYLNESRLFNDPRPITLSLSLVTVAFVVTSLAYSSHSVSVYAIPIGIAPLLLRMFFDFRISIFSFIILVLITGLFSSNPFEYIVVQTAAISFATLYQSSSTKRSRMLGTAVLVFIGYSAMYSIISIAQNGNLNGVLTENYGWFAINGLLCMMVFPLIYVVEKVFGYISETTLLELSDSNQPLLKELAMKAPGTFQHSLQVANLAEKVAARIGGNTVLLRTAAMYHDIGKMNEPQFFIENQLPENNPHDDLEPDESAGIIIGHVTKGIRKARQHDLPIDIIQFIQTHHGTSKVRYFLKRAKEQNPDIDESMFVYPGPKPNTKEQAILMMADSVEAASRSLKKYDHATLEKLVDGIIEHQRDERQFEDAPITFKDISMAKNVLKTSLKGIYHQRISYD